MAGFTVMHAPLTLILIFVSFALSVLCAARNTSSSTYDPFYDIAKLVKRDPDPPVCCLKPSPSPEPVEEFLSFEDWKAKQAALQRTGQHEDAPRHSANVVNSSRNASADAPPVDVQATQQADFEQASAPHFRVPLVDRFNYASLDCSARVHSSHKKAKSPSSILSSKKDKYMLSPCETSDYYFVVELCDDIRIDTVQLANFEFFSGIFKDFSVSVAKTITGTWTPAGTYQAKNVRGVQSFHPPTSLRDFYRFIRIDVLSHYGTEFYCPISLLRVYGLTHLEEWKWDQWKIESLAKREAIQIQNATEDVSTSAENSTDPSHGTEDDDVVEDVKAEENSSSISLSALPSLSKFLESTWTVIHSSEQMTSHPATTQASTSTDILQSESHSSTPSVAASTIDDGHSASTTQPETTSSSSTSISPSNSTTDVSDVVSSISTQPPSSPVATVVASQVYTLPAASSAGESIYRTIMNRLTVLEVNSTLYARYVEEQTRSIRDALRRLEEDVGRIEGIGKAQAQYSQKTLQEWEKQRTRLEREHGELLSRVNFLADEVILEKRLGIAQLSVLLIVLVFMALTRGSRAETVYEGSHVGSRDALNLRNWGRRNLRIGSDWASRFRSRSPTPTPTSPELGDSTRTGVSSRSTLHLPHTEYIVRKRTTSGSSKSRLSGTRTPTSRHFPVYRSLTPTAASFAQAMARAGALHGRPALTRSNSQTNAATNYYTTPKSARKWAKSSHLHELRMRPTPTPTSEKEKEQDDMDGRTVSPLTSRNRKKHLERFSRGSGSDREPRVALNGPNGVTSQWTTDGVLPVTPSSDDADGWIDTDMEEADSGSGFRIPQPLHYVDSALPLVSS